MNSLPGGVHWVRLLFFDLFLLGIDSAFSFLEAVSTCTKDMVAFKDTPKWKVTLAFCTIGFLISILYASDAGLFFLDTIDYYVNFLMIMVVSQTMFLNHSWNLISLMYFFKSYRVSLRALALVGSMALKINSTSLEKFQSLHTCSHTLAPSCSVVRFGLVLMMLKQQSGLEQFLS